MRSDHPAAQLFARGSRFATDMPLEPVKLGDEDAALRSLGGRERSELRSPIERIGTLARFYVDVFGNDLHALGFGKSLDGRPLGLDSKTGALLVLCGDPKVYNSCFHTNYIPPFTVCMKSQVEQCNCFVYVAQRNDAYLRVLFFYWTTESR